MRPTFLLKWDEGRYGVAQTWRSPSLTTFLSVFPIDFSLKMDTEGLSGILFIRSRFASGSREKETIFLRDHQDLNFPKKKNSGLIF